MARIEVRFDPHWVNRTVFRLFARPFVSHDGRDFPMSWTKPIALELDPGTVTLRAFARYRGTRTDLGTAQHTVDLHDGQHVRLVARNGWANHMPFQFHTEGKP